MPLKTLSDNIQTAPVTPGKQVRQLKSVIEKKDSQIDDLTKALTGLNLVKSKIEVDTNANNAEKTKKTKKDVDAPVPAKTAYKYFADANPQKEGVDMRLVWKEAAPELRKVFTAMAEADKARFTRENTAYEQEKRALEMYYEKKKQDTAMEFYEAHIAAAAALENSASENKKVKKKVKDPEAPKRPVSSYMYFAMEKRESVKAANPEAAPTEIVKILGENWSKLNKGKGGKNGTKKYDDMGAKDRSRYEAEKAIYDDMIAQRNIESAQDKAEQLKLEKEEAMKLFQSVQTTNDVPMSEAVEDDAAGKKIKKKKDPNAPKKPCSAYIFYSVENRAAIKAKMPETVTNTELLTEVGRQWKELTDKGKEKYNKMATKDKERYAKDMETYNPEKN